MNAPFHAKTLVRLCTLATLAVAAGAATAQAAATQVTRGAVAVTTTMGHLMSSQWNVSNLINQTNLVAPYVNGETSFASFAANTLYTVKATPWLSAFNNTSGFLSFDLGAAYSIGGMAWFGAAPNNQSRVNSLRVYADTDNNPSNGVGSLLFTSGNFGAAPNRQANVFNFDSAANTRYLAIEVAGVNGGSFATVNQVAFSQNLAVAAVPEPGTYALMGAGLGVVGFMARRRRSA